MMKLPWLVRAASIDSGSTPAASAASRSMRATVHAITYFPRIMRNVGAYNPPESSTKGISSRCAIASSTAFPASSQFAISSETWIGSPGTSSNEEFTRATRSPRSSHIQLGSGYMPRSTGLVMSMVAVVAVIVVLHIGSGRSYQYIRFGSAPCASRLAQAKGQTHRRARPYGKSPWASGNRRAPPRAVCLMGRMRAERMGARCGSMALGLHRACRGKERTGGDSLEGRKGRILAAYAIRRALHMPRTAEVGWTGRPSMRQTAGPCDVRRWPGRR